MSSGPVRVLMIASNDQDYQQIATLFTELPTGAYVLDRAADYESGLNALQRCQHDLYLVDERVGEHAGVALISNAARSHCRAPTILLAGQWNDEIDFQAAQMGAADVVEKDQLHVATLERSMQRALMRKRRREIIGEANDPTAKATRASAAPTVANQPLPAEEQNQKRVEAQLRDLDRRKDEFLASFVHELRNPLSPLSSAVQLIRLQPDKPDQVDELAAVMERQLAKLVRTIENAVDVLQILAGKMQLRKTHVSLAEAVAAGLEMGRRQIEGARLTVETLLPQEPILVDGDLSRLSQMVNHLLVNAVKHSPTGGIIQLVVQPEGPQAVIRVRDGGEGLSTEMQARVGEMLSHVGQGGLGTNLTLVKALVQLHGGSVHVFSRGPGTGCEFTIFLPLAAKAHSAASDSSWQPVGGGKRPLLRVLVVDDTKSAAHLLAKLFETLGQSVEMAFSGKEALERISVQRPHLVVSDVEMPDISGLELARQIRANPSLQQPKLVALTGYDRESDRRNIMGAGFDRHMTKPVGIQQLEQLIAEFTP